MIGQKASLSFLLIILHYQMFQLAAIKLLCIDKYIEMKCTVNSTWIFIIIGGLIKSFRPRQLVVGELRVQGKNNILWKGK